ncbi:phage shock protein D [Pantoea rodasii]|uniref:Phage shock protein D n=1 Tax=Pantoea rodasii TaxID=1076549 RepID=A0A2M9WER1_9GAMM|nr:phage shock protein PspD [Pantoea rodasii]ORM57707.1 phage shock protein D [Pantoea rodasii]PJZ06051.1 phage shock protein D [Pantoea rodasii]
MHNQRFTALRRRATPALKSAGKFIIISAVTYGPGGLAGWAVKSVARRPLRLLLAAALEPLLSKAFKRLSARFVRENDEKTAK